MRGLLALPFLVLFPLLPEPEARAAQQPMLGSAPSVIQAVWGRPLKTFHYPSGAVEHYGLCPGTTLPIHLVSYSDNRADIIATYRCDTTREQDWKGLAQHFLPTDAVLKDSVSVGAPNRPIYHSPSLAKTFPLGLCGGSATDRGLVMLEDLQIENHDVWIAGMSACLQPVLGGMVSTTVPPASAAPLSLVTSIRVRLDPTLLAVDPTTHEVYVRTVGNTYDGGLPGAGAGYTALDGTTGHILQTWKDTSTAPPFSFVPIDNGLRVVSSTSPLSVYPTGRTVNAMLAQVGSGVAAGQGHIVVDQQEKLVAVLTGLPSSSTTYVFTLWIFDAHTSRLLASTKLLEPWLAIAFDAATNRVLLVNLHSTQIFTLTSLHYLATIPHAVYLEAPTVAGYDNRIYDTDPVAVDTTLGRAVVVSGTNGHGQGTAQIIDLATGRVLQTLSMGIQPTAVQVDPVLHRAYILDFGSCTVNIVDLRGAKQVATVAVGLRSTGLAVNTATGKVFVSSPHAPTSYVLTFPADIIAHQSGCWSPPEP